MSKYFPLFFLMVVAYSYANIPKCNRQTSSIPNFDRSKILGTWYVIEAGEEYRKNKKRCLQGILSFENVLETGYINGKLDELDIKIQQLESKSKYITESREFSRTIVSVLDTDYTSYAIWFFCRNNHPQGGVFLITSRTRQPGAGFIEKAHESLANAGFKVDKLNLYSVDQSNC
nr:uncharacterized protein LOC111413824 [Onthophagus taurus]